MILIAMMTTKMKIKQNQIPQTVVLLEITKHQKEILMTMVLLLQVRMLMFKMMNLYYLNYHLEIKTNYTKLFKSKKILSETIFQNLQFVKLKNKKLMLSIIQKLLTKTLVKVFKGLIGNRLQQELIA